MRPPPQQIAWAQRYGRQYGVDPRLLLAIGGMETRWGNLGAGRPSQGGYVLGYGRGTSRYSGPENQYRYGAQTLSGWGAKTLADVLAGKAARWTPDSWWEKGVQSVYGSLGNLGGTPPTGGTGGGLPPSPGPPPSLPGAPAAAPASDPARTMILNALIAGRRINFLNLPPPRAQAQLGPMPLQPVTTSGKAVTTAPSDTGSVPLTGVPSSGAYPTMSQHGGNVPGFPGLVSAPQADVSHVDTHLLATLAAYARATGKHITIISGYRSPAYSARVGGYSNDPHTRGVAVDAYVNGVPIGSIPGAFAWFKAHGLESGAQPGFYRGKTDPEHLQIPGSGVNKSIHSRRTSRR